jgi:serine/threonine protein kinase
MMKIEDEDSDFILDKQSIINYSFQLLNSIEYLHKNYIAHRDIKPSNLIIDKDDKLHLLDFNVSRDYSKCKMMS